MVKAAGYGIIYGAPDAEGKIFDSGCFDDADMRDTRFLVEKVDPISNVAFGTAKLMLDEKGIKYITDLPQTLTGGRDVAESIRNGNFMGVDVHANIQTRIVDGVKHVTKVERLLGFRFNSNSNGTYSSAYLIDDDNLTVEELHERKRKLKLELELLG
ncbi:HK97 family phage prohead protease [Corticicoccus populi]|uniref:HK97 family phage prohead protease n=1 Tax=Corticicoccus populi TaxID=1812821 RepID=A0ABW5WYQ2_9STAP